jgi:hypothetical protein
VRSCGSHAGSTKSGEGEEEDGSADEGSFHGCFSFFGAQSKNIFGKPDTEDSMVLGCGKSIRIIYIEGSVRIKVPTVTN